MVWLNLVLAVLVAAILVVLNLDGYDATRKTVAVVALVGYGWVLLRYRRRTGNSRADGPSDYLIAFATETGTARQLAKSTARKLSGKGRIRVIELNQLAEASPPSRALLVVASTTGNGDSPRTGAHWAETDSFLEAYRDKDFAVLALGDRDYPCFCAFGIEVAASLGSAGARPLFDPVLVNRGDLASVTYWYRQLGVD